MDPELLTTFTCHPAGGRVLRPREELVLNVVKESMHFVFARECNSQIQRSFDSAPAPTRKRSGSEEDGGRFAQDDRNNASYPVLASPSTSALR
jgi:hypothetical protein